MRWCWFALVDEIPGDVLASAEVRELDGAPAGYFVAYSSEVRHPRGAARIAGHVIEPVSLLAGDPAEPAARMTVSLVLPPEGVEILFDDPAVVAAIQAVYARTGLDFVSTLTTDPVHFGGAISGTTTPWPGWWSEDPFGRIFGARRLCAEPGLFSTGAPPAGPVHQRYAGLPWPAEGFE